jgi:gliding motility-associated-like protein
MMCQTIIDTTVFIYPVISDFNRNNEIATIDTAHCLHIADQFFNTSINGSTWQWNFGDGNTSSLNDPQHTYQQAGIYNVTLSIHHDISGCTDTLIKQMIIYPKPDILANGGNICLGDTLQILTNNLIGLYQWEPSTNLNSPTSGNPYAFPTESTNYTVYFNDNNNCKDTAEANIFVQQPPIEWVRDTTIIIGESFNLNGEQQGGFTYVWSPETNLNCTICPNPNANPQNDITYYLTIQDTMGCNFITQNQYDVIVLPVSSVDVPSAFTPNGDGSNDIIYVRGWGIKKLLEFSVYNRWGELMFTTNDINVGWDGTFNGKPQNIDTYAYYVRVETYIDVAPLSKKGNFTLLR